jgi:hypothetical protein
MTEQQGFVIQFMCGLMEARMGVYANRSRWPEGFEGACILEQRWILDVE